MFYYILIETYLQMKTRKLFFGGFMQRDYIQLDSYTGEILSTCLPSEDLLYRLSGLFSMFSDSTRLKIIYALSISEMCVTDLAIALEINQSTLSHQLKALRSVGIITAKRKGKIIFYFASVDFVNELMLSGVDFLRRI